jgi:hypothetical protein
MFLALSAADRNREVGPRLAVEYLEDTLRRPTDHGTITDDRYRPLHQLGMFEEQRNDSIFTRVVGRIKSEFGEVTVDSNHVGDRIGQLGDDAS